MQQESRLRRSMFGSNDQYAQTPDHVLDQLKSMFNRGKPMWDPCPVNPQHDALTLEDWQSDCCYLNPPYGNIQPFLEKAIVETKKGRTIVALIPCRCNTNWYHDKVLNETHVHEIHHVRQGVKFKNYKKKSPFAVCVVVYRPTPRRRLEVKSLDFYTKK